MARWLRDSLVLLAIVVMVAGGSFGMQRALPFVASIERWIADYRIATVAKPEPQHPDIVIVAITEETLEQFPYRAPVDRRFLSELLRTLDQRGVRGILLDLMLDQPTEADKDDVLKQTMDALKTPLVVSYAREEEALTANQVEYLDAYLRPDLRGFANLEKDRFDDTPRWIYPGRALPDGSFLPGIATVLMQKLGVAVPGKRTELAYRARPDAKTEPFASFPAHTLAVLPPEWFKDKIVLIGADQSLVDRHRSPFAAAFEGQAAMLPGVVFHAHAIAQLLAHRVAPEVGWPAELGVLAVCAVLGALLGMIRMGLTLRVGSAIFVVLVLWAGGFVLFRYASVLVPLVTPSLAVGMALWLTEVYTGRLEREEKKFIQSAFAKYVSPTLLDEIVENPQRLSLVAKRREMSFIFTDVAGFTALIEKMDARVLAAMMNEYFNGLCAVIFKHGGTVDKFIGDAVFAIFNAPRLQKDHHRRAVACALELDAFAQSFMAQQAEKGRRFGITRIGVHSGWANVGNFGSDLRFEYTALGDTVNTASRLEGLNRFFGTRITVSGATAKRCRRQPFRPLGRVVLRGKTEAIDVFEPVTVEQAKSDYMQTYRKAYALLAEGDRSADDLLRSLQTLDPGDPCVSFHRDRIAEGVVSNHIEMADK
jgi:class 3 adenylate cyclase/CHASE2 domain-containing sensor protein